MAGYGQAAGVALMGIGTAIGGFAADNKRGEYLNLMRSLGKPDPGTEEANYFNDLNKFYDQANTLSNRATQDDFNQKLRLREQALPGSTKALSDSMRSISPLLNGQLPQSVMDNFMRAGGAGATGAGFGGSQYGALTTGLFGARGSLGAIQTGMGLLPTLLHSMPNVSAPSTMNLLSQLMSPAQRVALQMQLRGQQIGINTTYNQMPDMMEAWSQGLMQMGGTLAGGGGGGQQQQQSSGGSGAIEWNPNYWGTMPTGGYGKTQGPNEGSGE